MTLTGEPRRWANEPGIPGVVHVLDPYHGIQRGWDDAATSLAMIEEVIQLEGAHTIAAFILETVTGTNGILIPPDGYLEGVRRLCDKYNILMIADEVMAGFGRTGRWFAIDHWNIVPDLITMAKGLTSGYLPLGAVGMRRAIADHFKDKVFYGGLTYGSHPVACATALATIGVYEEDGLIENAQRMGALMTTLMRELSDRHRSVGATRNIGLFGIVELVKSRGTMEPLAPFNGTAPEMAAFNKALRAQGVYTVVRWNTFFTNPPLCITEAELREGFAAIDSALTVVDRMLG
jgi:taurine--2-oxoglutarate transaminase